MYNFDLIHYTDCLNNQKGTCWFYKIPCDEVSNCKLKDIRKDLNKRFNKNNEKEVINI